MNINPNCKDCLHFMNATSDFTSMDLQVQKGSTRTTDAQQPVAASVNHLFEHWSSTSVQGPTSYEVLSVSSLVPSTVLTILPQYTPSTYRNIYPELPSISEVTSEPQLPKTPSSSSGSSEAHDQKTLTSPLPCSNNPQEVQQRKTSDGGPLEEGSVDLILPKDLPNEEPGMVIINTLVHKGVFSPKKSGQALILFQTNLVPKHCSI